MYAERVDSAGNLPDTAHPTVTLGSTAGSVTATPCIPVTATFSEPVTGFTIDDIAVGNGIACDFAAGSARIYTFDITPVEQGQVTVDIAAGAARDAAGNGNTAAVQYRITYARPWPTITSFTAIPGDHADTVVVTGTNFTGACGVMFGDRSAISFSVDSDSQITAMAEHGVSGRILIAAPQGTAISDDVYSGHVPSPVEPDQSRAVPRVWVWPVAAIVAFLGIAAASSFAVWLRGRMAIRPDTGHH